MTDWKDLNSGERDALKRLATGKWFLVSGGYALPGEPKIQLSTARALVAKHLAREVLEKGRRRLMPTAIGFVVLDERAAPKANIHN